MHDSLNCLFVCFAVMSRSGTPLPCPRPPPSGPRVINGVIQTAKKTITRTPTKLCSSNPCRAPGHEFHDCEDGERCLEDTFSFANGPHGQHCRDCLRVILQLAPEEVIPEDQRGTESAADIITMM